MQSNKPGSMTGGCACRAVRYRIVGDDEADVKKNLISVSSPIARALIGKEEGDVVVVRAPGGDVEYEIDQVHHI